MASEINIDEKVIWEGSQSQILLIANYIGVLFAVIIISAAAIIVIPEPYSIIVLALDLIPLAYLGYKIIMVKSVRYKVTDQRVICSTGIFSKNTTFIELYRVKDLEISQSFLMRMFRHGNITLITHDTSSPRFTLNAVPAPHELYDRLRIAIEKRRDLKRVRGIEFDSDDINIE